MNGFRLWTGEDNAIFASYGDPSDQVRLVATGLSVGDARVIVQAMNVLPELLEEYYSLKRMYEAKFTLPESTTTGKKQRYSVG